MNPHIQAFYAAQHRKYTFMVADAVTRILRWQTDLSSYMWPPHIVLNSLWLAHADIVMILARQGGAGAWRVLVPKTKLFEPVLSFFLFGHNLGVVYSQWQSRIVRFVSVFEVAGTNAAGFGGIPWRAILSINTQKKYTKFWKLALSYAANFLIKWCELSLATRPEQDSKYQLDRRPRASDFSIRPVNSRLDKSGAAVLCFSIE